KIAVALVSVEPISIAPSHQQTERLAQTQSFIRQRQVLDVTFVAQIPGNLVHKANAHPRLALVAQGLVRPASPRVFRGEQSADHAPRRWRAQIGPRAGPPIHRALPSPLQSKHPGYVNQTIPGQIKPTPAILDAYRPHPLRHEGRAEYQHWRMPAFVRYIGIR